MKIITWNIRGSHSPHKRRAIKSFLCKEDPDIIVLQEVKRDKIDRRFVGSISRSRFKEWIIIPALGRSGGLSVAWDVRKVSVVDNLVGNFSISIKIEAGLEIWWFTGIYGPCGIAGRKEFWDELAGISTFSGQNWCVGGDFNVVRSAEEKNTGNRSYRSMRQFDEVIRELELIDSPLTNGSYTWSNFRARPTCCRLDRFLVSTGWRGLFPSDRQEIGSRIVSDHSPVILQNGIKRWGPSPFRFDNIWLENKEFLAQVKRWWVELSAEGWEGFKFFSKMKLLKEKIILWCGEKRKAEINEKCELMRRLTELDRLEGTEEWNDSFLRERLLVKSSLHMILEKEERALRIRSKFQWAKLGDANSKLFHILMNGRRARNAMEKIERGDGTLAEEEEEIVEEVQRFFGDLYTSQGTVLGDWGDVSWDPIPLETSELLGRPFEEEEVKSAIFSMDGDKSPGPDGFSIAFYKAN